MGKWVDMFQEARDTREREREAWKSVHGGRRAPSFPKELAKYPALIDKEWIHNAMSKAKAQGEQISPREWEYARECLPKVINQMCMSISVFVCIWKYVCLDITCIDFASSYLQINVVQRASFLHAQDR